MLNYSCKNFHKLSLEELYALMALRQEVFIVEQDCPYLDADGKDQKGWHLMGWNKKGELLACARLLPAGVSYPDHASIGRVVTSEKIRRTGQGIRLMQIAMYWCEQLFPKTPLKISAQCYLQKFYESFGFQAVGEPYLEDDIPHIAMVHTHQ
jgi:ElaA protein